MAKNTALAIEVQNLWQVFGADAKKKFSEAQVSENLTENLKSQDLIPAVQDACFEIKQGELFVIMGLSGSGKSTLLRCLSRLVEPTSGTVLVEGENILTANKKRMTELRRDKLGMVFQHFGLFEHMTVIDNVSFPLKVKGQSLKARHARAQEMIDLVGLSGREDAHPRELSGGQRQRVGIARSLAVNPDIWFLDEPFSALDPLIRRKLQDEFLSIQEKLNKSIVFVTHDITEALKLADRIAIMRDGKIVQIGTPTEIVLSPVDDYVREFSKDVAKGRHMTLEALMDPVNGKLPKSAMTLNVGMSLEKAMATCTSDLKPIAIEDDQGKIVGVLRPEKLSETLNQVAE